MKIINLQAENVKKLIAIDITPTGNLVEISGKNGQGKTSVLDSLWWALSGAANIQGSPIRNGEKQALIKLDFGEFIVTRTFKKDDNRTTSTIRIEDAEGTVIRQPQTMLDKLLGQLSFDPLAFARMSKKQQFEQLKRFVPGVDFEAIEAERLKLYDQRTNINRQALEAKVLADKIVVSIEAGEKEVDESALIQELEDAGKHNSSIEQRKANRNKLKDRQEFLQSEIKKLSEQVAEMKKEAGDIVEKFLNAPTLPEPIDTSVITNKIKVARETNKKFEYLGRREGHLLTRQNLLEESHAITEQIETIDADKRSKIAEAKLPVEGLGFGDNEILIDDVPFNQASDAEQLQVSIAMAMALNPDIRVIRVRDGSLLDEDSMAMLAKMADDKDYQVWIETVNSGKAGAIVLEDGMIKQVEVSHVS